MQFSDFIRVVHIAGILLVLVAGLQATVARAAGHPSTDPEGWRLTFEDDFDDDRLDGTKWTILPEGASTSPRVDGYWAQSQAFVDGKGHLIIQVDQVGDAYHSGAVRSKGKFEQAYGYFEIRAQLPKEEGFWTAFWLMADSVHRVGDEGRDGTEIDIYESPHPKLDIVQHALHWDGYGEHHRSTGRRIYLPGIYDGFHTFALEWNEDEYVFYIDGVETWRTHAGGVSKAPAYLKVSAEVGTWGGDIRRAKLPAQLVVDYVRVWERKHRVAIVSPAFDAKVPPDAPVVISVDPSLSVAEVTVAQNGVQIYQGDDLPKDLRLALPVSGPAEEHWLHVRVTDAEGRVWERASRFMVEQLSLGLPGTEMGTHRLSGTLSIRAAAGLAAREGVTMARLTLRPVESSGQGEPKILYEGERLPEVFLDTEEWADGPYDLELTATTDQDRSLKTVARIVVDNWNELEEPFAPPVSFFGMPVDSLITAARSDGWEFPTDDAAQFFGDDTRVRPIGGRDEYMVWKLERLGRFRLEAYVRDEASIERLRFDASAGGDEWLGVPYEAVVEETSELGWHKLVVTGTIPASLGADHFRISIVGGDGGETGLELGLLRLAGRRE